MTNPNFGEPVLSSNPVLNAIKKLGSSSLFLATAILYSVSTVLSIFVSLRASAVSYSVYSILEQSGIDYDGVTNFSVNLSPVISILICVAMWMIYATCRNRTTGNISTAGLTICKVIAIITQVALWIVLAGVVILFIAGFAGGFGYLIRYGLPSSFGYGDGVVAVLLFLMIVLLALVALLIAFYISAVRCINRIKGCAITGTPDRRISRFLTTMLWISGVISCLGGLFTLFTSPLEGIEMLASAACSILLAILLGQLRQQMTVLAYPPVQPVYAGQPMYQPVQPAQPAYPQQASVPAPTSEPASAPAEEPVPAEEPAPAEESAPADVPEDDKPEE